VEEKTPVAAPIVEPKPDLESIAKQKQAENDRKKWLSKLRIFQKFRFEVENLYAIIERYVKNMH
jgi:hypothetical protein